MLTKDDMVKVQRSDSIQSLFKTLLKLKPSIILWQNLGLPQRVKHQVSFKKLDERKREMIFFPKNKYFSFSAAHPIYFYSPKRTTIFKNAIYYNSSYQLGIKLPETIMLKNIRQSDRETCDEMVQFMFGDKSAGGREFWFKSPMIDRAPGGFSFKSSINNVIRFQVGQKIQYKFKSMGSFGIGEIVSVVSYVRDSKFFRISVKNVTY